VNSPCLGEYKVGMTTTAHDTGTSASLSFSLADAVLHRTVQLLQLAMMTGTDVADHLRALRLRPRAVEGTVLELTPECDAAFEAGLRQLQDRADELIAQSQAPEVQGPSLILAGA